MADTGVIDTNGKRNAFRTLPVEKDSHALYDKVRSVLKRAGNAPFIGSGVATNDYLVMSEKIVRTAVKWQNADGAIIDPLFKKEWAQTSPRFASSAAVLNAFGRAMDLSGAVAKSMDWCTRRLAEGKGESPDFWMRELATAWYCAKGIAPGDKHASWTDWISRVVPENIYTNVVPKRKMEDIYNWAVYASAGECMREAFGIGAAGEMLWGNRFFDTYMPHQLEHFSDLGMYRDPGDPITYDITTRLQIATALVSGYNGTLSGVLNRNLQRGALSTLLFLSPGGYVPYGGRSAQFQFQEAIIAALCEIEARRYAATDKALAGAFKRQAHLSARAMNRWIHGMNPPRHIKNAYTYEQGVGIDGYGYPSVYLLLASSFLGLAALFADDTIAEAPAPVDIGGYVFECPDAFHKVFAVACGTGIEIDTKADPHYDATGLGRFCMDGVSLESALAMPFTAEPRYTVPEGTVPAVPCAIGVRWFSGGVWDSLAAHTDAEAVVAVKAAAADRVMFTVSYVIGTIRVVETYGLARGTLLIQAAVSGIPVEKIAFTVPLIETDGESISTISSLPEKTELHYREAAYTVEHAHGASIGAEKIANRNGVYRILTTETHGNSITCVLSFAHEGATR
ncbi:MAG: hypothetical protein HZC28_16940 [Spirochaetes bacterium]|nr:hypothetical protein [Spirochaetota bacterium]